MSSKSGKSFGTQSPPLEATGEDKPMGVSSVDGHKPDAVSDMQQREQYFQNTQTTKESTNQAGTGIPSQTKIKTD
ncbi:uncharacterized protein FIBRA_01585 [Fibroporia radiculosa]|uniref:Uncharacterized protein n=1 Tax=Fibroporia radiculosa TaxID=599839 RepID=J4HTK4_9APHY|nr:uncharacterized protein FIBRA_01585 [Fibroporia radiculosa]CCL99567.1 predicted protein [Fibroporia radiculosa]